LAIIKRPFDFKDAINRGKVAVFWQRQPALVTGIDHQFTWFAQESSFYCIQFLFQGMQSEFVMNEAINALFMFPQAGFVRKYCNSLDINATT
jgi:hypothetical protein